MDTKKTVPLSSEPIIPLNFNEPPNFENSGSNNTAEVLALANKNNCSIYIFCLYIVLAISTITIVSAVYILNSLKLDVMVDLDQPPSGSMYYRNVSNSSDDCSLVNPVVADWFHVSHNSPVYTCEVFKTVSNVNIQSLQVRGHGCNDTDNCYDLIHTYLGIMEGHSKFSYFVDNDTNVYGGRGWYCQFWEGQVWVAVMVDGFGAASQTEKDRILHHFKEGVIPHAKHCTKNLSELHFNYFDDIAM